MVVVVVEVEKEVDAKGESFSIEASRSSIGTLFFSLLLLSSPHHFIISSSSHLVDGVDPPRVE